MENTVEEKGLRLDDLKVSSLPELQGWKEKQEQLVIDNPFVEIIDNKSYEIACKSRTSLLKGRTELEKQDKLIASKLTAFRKDVKAETESLIAITLPSEEKQQEEVKRYENVKAIAKAEEERIERERIEKIEKKISDFESDSYKIIQETNIGNVESHKTMLDAFVNDEFDYEEYEIMFEQARIRVQSYWDNKCNEVQEKEQQRLENERMKQEIFKVRIARLKEAGYDLSGEVESDTKDESYFEFQSILNCSADEFEIILAETKLGKEKAEREQLDAELKKQKDEQFEIRKNRLDEIGVVLTPHNGFSFVIYDIQNINKELVFNASITEFESILFNAKNQIIEAKEQKEIAEQQLKEAQELELLLKEKAEKQKAIDLELSKKDAERLKKENAQRVKRLANDKKIVSESLEVYFSKVYLETENKEILEFIDKVNQQIQELKTDLLTQLNNL